MALSGIQIYKLLPQTNCKECGFPTCLAFAMKLAAKQVELSSCPYVSETSKAQLAESSAPPIRLVTLKAGVNEVKAGNEVVLHRHEKTFYNRPGIFARLCDDLSEAEILAEAKRLDAYMVNYVGIELKLDGVAVESLSGDPGKFAATVKAVRQGCSRPLALISSQPAVIAEGLKSLPGETPLIIAADADNWEAMAALVLATTPRPALAVTAPDLDGLADLTEKLKGKGIEDVVLSLQTSNMAKSLELNTQIRRLAIKKNLRALGFPTLAFPVTIPQAAQAIAKYAGFVILDRPGTAASFAPELVYPLLVLRQNIYTDPQKPIQVLPGLYEINNPGPQDPVLVTTNFSITYFSIANEVEGSGLPAWLLVTDAEGMSVLTAWAAGKFDAERIAKAVKELKISEKVSRQRIVIPGHVAVLSGELESELPDWEIRVGPREAVDVPAFMKQAL